MATTYTLISSVTVGSGGAANIEFTSIPQTYTDLIIKSSVRGTLSADVVSLDISFNSSTSTFSQKYLVSNAGGAFTGSQARWVTYTDGGTATANTFSNDEIYIPNYASNNYKSFSSDSVEEQNGATAYMGLFAGLWSTTSPITSITLTPASGNITQNSTAYLYGISNA